MKIKSTFGRHTAHKWMMFRNMVTSLIEHERIKTTTPKAKEVRRVADRMITWAKQGTLHARRQARRVVTTDEHLKKLFDILGPRYQNRQGGYTRYLKLQKFRRGDGADMSVVEFVDREEELRPARPPSGSGASSLKSNENIKAIGGQEDVKVTDVKF